MTRLSLLLSILSLLISAFALHMADRNRRDFQAFAHSMPRLADRPETR